MPIRYSDLRRVKDEQLFERGGGDLGDYLEKAQKMAKMLQMKGLRIKRLGQKMLALRIKAVRLEADARNKEEELKAKGQDSEQIDAVVERIKDQAKSLEDQADAIDDKIKNLTEDDRRAGSIHAAVEAKVKYLVALEKSKNLEGESKKREMELAKKYQADAQHREAVLKLQGEVLDAEEELAQVMGRCEKAGEKYSGVSDYKDGMDDVDDEEEGAEKKKSDQERDIKRLESIDDDLEELDAQISALEARRTEDLQNFKDDEDDGDIKSAKARIAYAKKLTVLRNSQLKLLKDAVSIFKAAGIDIDTSSSSSSSALGGSSSASKKKRPKPPKR